MRHIATHPNRYGDLIVSDTILVEGLRRTGFNLCSLGIVPEGSEGRQEFQGPMVPGPWGFTTTRANIIDASGLAAAERARAIRLHVGEPFTIEGLPGTWMLRSPRQFEGDGAKLVPHDPNHPEAAAFLAR